MKQDVRYYIRTCPTYQKSKTDFKPNRNPYVDNNHVGYILRKNSDGRSRSTSRNSKQEPTLQDDLTKLIDLYTMHQHLREFSVSIIIPRHWIHLANVQTSQQNAFDKTKTYLTIPSLN